VDQDMVADSAELQHLPMVVDSADLLLQLLMALLPMVEAAMAVAAMATHPAAVEDNPGGKLLQDDASLFLFRFFSTLVQTT